MVTTKDDAHHFPHRSLGGEDIPEHIWMSKRICHRYLHDYPDVEAEVFKKIADAGYQVIWKAPLKI